MNNKEMLKNLNELLTVSGISGCYKLGCQIETDKKEVAESQKEIINKKQESVGAICCGCGQKIVRIIFLHPLRYCEDCIKCKNKKFDYEMIFAEVDKWMQEFMELPGKINFCVRPKIISWIGMRPLWRISFLGIKIIIGRELVRRDVIAAYLVFEYVKFWMSEKGDNGETNFKFYTKALAGEGKKIKKIIPYWYMLQYMYYKGNYDQIGRMEKLLLKKEDEKEKFKEFEKKYPIHKFSNEDNDREGIKNLVQNHPVKIIRHKKIIEDK